VEIDRTNPSSDRNWSNENFCARSILSDLEKAILLVLELGEFYTARITLRPAGCSAVRELSPRLRSRSQFVAEDTRRTAGSSFANPSSGALDNGQHVQHHGAQLTADPKSEKPNL
jgi:hypothetical protein